MTLKAPFPWFGGKRLVAPFVWEALGDVDRYVEPFAGSLAVLLGRPEEHRRRFEIVNDADMFLANFWRAISFDPDTVADNADWPVNECDLFARHVWLVNTGRDRIAALESDPEFYDPKVAGWWVWGQCVWIGGGWCSGEGPWGIHGDSGRRVSRRRPHLSAGRGVNRNLPHLDAGRGVSRHLDSGLHDYFRVLAERLRKVVVCCGDWQRVLTDGALSHGNTVGVFLDPPYLGDVRASDIYSVDDHTIANDVREWAIAHGDNPRMRIVLAGYETEHGHLMPYNWRKLEYSAGRAYGRSAGPTKNSENRHLERLWFSPGCLTVRPTLFDNITAKGA